MARRYNQQSVLPLLQSFYELGNAAALSSAVRELLGQPTELASARPLRDSVDLDQVRTLLYHARVAQRMSQRDLAEQTGLDSANLGRLERGEAPNPTISTLSRIAAALGKKLVVALVDAEDHNDAAPQESDPLETPPGDPLDELLRLPSLEELFQ